MKKVILVVLVSLVVSAAALAAPNPANATAHCKKLLKTAPSAYPSLSACVTAQTAAAADAASNAAKKCRAERDGDPAAFAAAHSGKSFADFHGTTGNKKNAFGKCVSAKADKEVATEQTAELNAAKQCKAWRADPAFAAGHGGKSFADFYGTNANKKNAFGKCVSKLAKAQS